MTTSALTIQIDYPVTPVEGKEPAIVAVEVEAEESSPKEAEATEKIVGSKGVSHFRFSTIVS